MFTSILRTLIVVTNGRGKTNYYVNLYLKVKFFKLISLKLSKSKEIDMKIFKNHEFENP